MTNKVATTIPIAVAVCRVNAPKAAPIAAVSVVRIRPVEYADVMTNAPRAPSTSRAIVAPNELLPAGS
ncbi:hypothetical protein GCM10029992_26210 [Glycomyces albus]